MFISLTIFTTLLVWAGLEIPKDRLIDGVDQGPFFEGKQVRSNREGFPFWLGSELYGVKWHNFKLVLINLDTDPKEREPLAYPYLHTWVGAHTAKILEEYQDSVKRESLIPLGAPLDYIPKQKR